MVDGAERHRGLLRKRKRLVARVNCCINLETVSAAKLWRFRMWHVHSGVVLWTQGSTLHTLAHRRAEGGRVLGGMVLRRRRMRGCRRELMCWRRAQTMRRRLCMRHCIELRSGGRKRLRGVRGVHPSCCGAKNGGCDGFGESLVETPGSAGCHEDEVRMRSKGPGLRFLRNGRCVLSKVPRLRRRPSS